MRSSRLPTAFLTTLLFCDNPPLNLPARICFIHWIAQVIAALSEKISGDMAVLSAALEADKKRWKSIVQGRLTAITSIDASSPPFTNAPGAGGGGSAGDGATPASGNRQLSVLGVLPGNPGNGSNGADSEI